jgi:hypothetical protein
MTKKIMNATKTMMTNGQIEDAVNKFRSAMHKHRSEITSDIAQQVLGSDNFGMMMFAPFRERAKMLSSLIVHKFKVNRSRSPQEVFNAVGGIQDINREALDTMPRGEGDEAETFSFELEAWEYTCDDEIGDDDLGKAYIRRNLKAASPDYVAAGIETGVFADGKYGTHWKGAEGNWCHAAFSYWRVVRRVKVNCYGNGWSGGWIFIGVRK